jgi:hypothetical protein
MKHKYVSVTTSGNGMHVNENGGNRDSAEDKLDYTLLPIPALNRITQHYVNGLKKYGRDMIIEEWKEIDLIDNVEVSNYGKIRNKKTKKEYSQWINKWGYCLVTIKREGTKKKHYQVHRLVMTAFVGKSKLNVNHIDGNKRNNIITNLEYLTQKENIKHSIDNGLSNFAYTQKYAKLTFEIAEEIRRRVANKEKQRNLAIEFGVTPATINDIVKYRIWKEDLSLKMSKERFNWHKLSTPEDIERYKQSMFRHLIQYLEGQDNEDHLAAVVWNAMALLYFEEKED